MDLEKMIADLGSKIGWTDFTWNPWTGCRKVSPGCKFCYMYRDKERYKKDPTDVLRSSSKFNFPLKLQKMFKGFEERSGLQAHRRIRIFTCSWSDFFIEEADEWRADAWKIIKNTPEFDYQILTKRPERIIENLPPDWGEGYPNVWLGISAENTDILNQRMNIFDTVPSKIKFISVEPMLGPTSFTYWFLSSAQIDWIIIGGESGNEKGKYKYRPSYLDWYLRLIEECRIYKVPVFMKQTGTYLAKILKLKSRHGSDLSEWPEQLKVQNFPKE